MPAAAFAYAVSCTSQSLMRSASVSREMLLQPITSARRNGNNPLADIVPGCKYHQCARNNNDSRVSKELCGNGAHVSLASFRKKRAPEVLCFSRKLIMYALPGRFVNDDDHWCTSAAEHLVLVILQLEMLDVKWVILFTHGPNYKMRLTLSFFNARSSS